MASLLNEININSIDIQGKTALHYVAENGHRNIVEFLTSARALPGFGIPLHGSKSRC